MTEDKVAYLGNENIARLQPSGPEPLGWALQKKIEETLEQFMEENEINISTVIGALELIKMNLYLSIALDEEED